MLCAAKGTVLAMESVYENHGLLTLAFKRALEEVLEYKKSKGQSQWTTFSTIGDHVAELVATNTKYQQVPVHGRMNEFGSGDFLFCRATLSDSARPAHKQKITAHTRTQMHIHTHSYTHASSSSSSTVNADYGSVHETSRFVVCVTE